MTSKFNLETYTTFLSANGNRFSGVEASKVLKHTDHSLSHDTISRWLREQTYTSDDLWTYVSSHIGTNDTLILDDSTLDKRWSPKNELTHIHWSGNEHRLVRGISLVNLLSTNGTTRIPVDYRIYEGKESKITKNDHAQTMLATAKKRGLEPRYVMADCWYSSLENMKHIVKLGWNFIMGLKENRMVSEARCAFADGAASDPGHPG